MHGGEGRTSKEKRCVSVGQSSYPTAPFTPPIGEFFKLGLELYSLDIPRTQILDHNGCQKSHFKEWIQKMTLPIVFANTRNVRNGEDNVSDHGTMECESNCTHICSSVVHFVQ